MNMVPQSLGGTLANTRKVTQGAPNLAVGEGFKQIFSGIQQMETGFDIV